LGRSRGEWSTKTHDATIDENRAVALHLTPGQAHDLKASPRASTPTTFWSPPRSTKAKVQTHRLIAITDTLLLLARADAGRLPLQPGDFVSSRDGWTEFESVIPARATA
jgi:hypothetical protein